ncbi:MAG: hypothetical protein WCJ58_06855 [bacterium]
MNPSIQSNKQKLMHFSLGLIANIFMNLIVTLISVLATYIGMSSSNQTNNSFPGYSLLISLFSFLPYILGFLLLITNILLIIYFLKSDKRYIGIGMLAAMIIIFVIAPFLLVGGCFVMLLIPGGGIV